jgi:uncharacterized protein YfaS (alpha-2-macroglobulin family)
MCSARRSSRGQAFSPAADSLNSFVPGIGYVQVSFSPIPMDAAALYDSLDQYPYGCTEQITSRALPLLYANQIAALAGRKTPGDLRKGQIQDAVSTLLNRQGADGAIGLWRTGDALSTPVARRLCDGLPVPREGCRLRCAGCGARQGV